MRASLTRNLCFSFLCAITIGSFCDGAAAQPFTPLQRWPTNPGSGNGNGEFDFPHGLVFASGSIYVADTFNDRIQRFGPIGAYQSQWGVSGTSDGEFSRPTDVAADSSGNIYVVDSQNHRVQKFTATGSFQLKWGQEGTASGEFKTPWALAIDGQDRVYVLDQANHRIQRFSSSGAFQLQWSLPGAAAFAYGVAVDSLSNVYVTLSDFRVRKYTNSGSFVLEWGSNGSGNGQFLAPRGIEVDDANQVFVVDSGIQNVQKFSATGTYLGQFGSPGTGLGELRNPWGVCADDQDNVFVCDQNPSHRVAKFYDGFECFLFLGLGATDVPIPPNDHYLVNHVVMMWSVLILSVPTITIPRHPGLNGLDLYFQVALWNPKVFPSDPLKMSNGLKVTIGGSETSYGNHSGLRLWAPMPARIGRDFKVAFRGR